jgi:hypothetical protein
MPVIILARAFKIRNRLIAVANDAERHLQTSSLDGPLSQ